MDQRQIDELLDLLSRIAAAVEALAVSANSAFRADYSRPKQRRDQAEHDHGVSSPSNTKSEE